MVGYCGWSKLCHTKVCFDLKSARFSPGTLSNFIHDVARHLLYAVTELPYTTTGVLRLAYPGIMVELRGISPIVLRLIAVCYNRIKLRAIEISCAA